MLDRQGVSRYGVQNDGNVSSTQCCHIFDADSQCCKVSTGDDGEGASKGETGSAQGILKAFWITMGDTLVQKDGIHNLRNVMTLWLSCREDFDTFFVWFEPTGVKHQVCSAS